MILNVVFLVVIVFVFKEKIFLPMGIMAPCGRGETKNLEKEHQSDVAFIE